MQTANCLIPTERLRLLPSASEQSQQQDPRQPTANIGAEIKHRLWKVYRESASPELETVELVVFGFFVFVAVVATALLISGLFYALGSGALEETVRVTPEQMSGFWYLHATIPASRKEK